MALDLSLLQFTASNPDAPELKRTSAVQITLLGTKQCPIQRNPLREVASDSYVVSHGSWYDVWRSLVSFAISPFYRTLAGLILIVGWGGDSVHYLRSEGCERIYPDGIISVEK